MSITVKDMRKQSQSPTIGAKFRQWRQKLPDTTPTIYTICRKTSERKGEGLKTGENGLAQPNKAKHNSRFIKTLRFLAEKKCQKKRKRSGKARESSLINW